MKTTIFHNYNNILRKREIIVSIGLYNKVLFIIFPIKVNNHHLRLDVYYKSLSNFIGSCMLLISLSRYSISIKVYLSVGKNYSIKVSNLEKNKIDQNLNTFIKYSKRKNKVSMLDESLCTYRNVVG